MASTTERGSHRGHRTGRRRAPRGRRARTTPQRRTGGVLRGVVHFVGELMFTAGLVMLLFAAYEIYGKQHETDQEQEHLSKGLERQWEAPKGPDSAPLPGSANSRMYIPGLDLDWVVVNGTAPADIKYSPGHYSDSAEAGQKGNYAVAGHRTSGIFWDLDKLDNGDDIVVEDRDSFYTYEVSETRTVTPDHTEVVDPDPDDPKNNDSPERSLLTLTTCAPKLNNTHRLIVHAQLEDTRSKDHGMPDTIAGMAPERKKDDEKKDDGG